MTHHSRNFLPLGDFKPADQWQTHVNSIFYGIQGPGIHDHFQTYVSRDHRLAHALAEDFFAVARAQGPASSPLIVQEWGVGNGNLAACFLARLRELDGEGKVYPRTHYVLCDYSREILGGTRANALLQEHAGRFSAALMDAEGTDCFKPRSVCKILSNEIWDDLAAKALLKHDGLLLEEYLQPFLEPAAVDMDFEEFRTLFGNRDLDALKNLPPFLHAIHWERSYRRVDVGDWPYAGTIRSLMDRAQEDIPIPVNIGAFAALERALRLLAGENQGYCGFDYGMFSLRELNEAGRPYFNLYGGQYTFMVNFELLAEVGKAAGFKTVEKDYQRRYVGQRLGENLLSVVEIVQTHPRIAEMPPWDRDALMLGTLHALNGTYKSPYKRILEYPVAPGTPKKQRKEIARLAGTLNPRGVPDTVAYVTASETFAVLKQLQRLGYRERDLRRTFEDPEQTIAFVYMKFQ